MKKPRTPSDIAKTRPSKKICSYSILRANAEAIEELAAKEDVPASELIDAAIEYYIEAVRADGNGKSKSDK